MNPLMTAYKAKQIQDKKVNERLVEQWNEIVIEIAFAVAKRDEPRIFVLDLLDANKAMLISLGYSVEYSPGAPEDGDWKISW